MRVEDLADPRLEPFRDLRAERDRRHDRVFICEGQICIRRALENSRFHVETLIATAPQLDALAPLVREGTVVLEASNALLQQVTGFKFHRGCLATVERPPPLGPSFASLGARSRCVFAEAVSNPSNMGALIRNCRSFGADLLVYTESSADPFSRRAVRTAMGNVFSLPLACVPDLAESIREYRAATGAEVFAATLGEKARPLRALARASHMGIVLGTENTGLLPATIAATSAEVTIPMAAGADSLNVAAASAVMLYELSQP